MPLRVIVLTSLVSWSLGCSCSSTPSRPCSSSSECTGGRMCVDGACRAVDASLAEDAATLEVGNDAPPRDAPAGDHVCVAVENAAVEIRRPIDAIVLPDESPSMGAARDAVANAMETTFRTTMDTAGIDYHVIWNGTTALPMLQATGRLTRNPIALGSGNDAMFKPALDTYDTWRPALRDDALKVFIHFTDATSGTGAAIAGYTGTFDEVLVTREPALWGTTGDYHFVYHSFVGLTPNTPATAPYEPTDPIVTGSCSGAFVNPVALQSMAQRTGGLRYPLCDAAHFDAVFQRIAESAIARATVPCEIEIPDPPAGMTLDLDTLAVRYTDGSGVSSILLRADTAAECTDTGFTLETDRVVLCPAACAIVEADAAATLTVLTGCDPMLI